MTIIMLLWWSLGRGNPAVPSRWQATIEARHSIGLIGHADNAKSFLKERGRSSPEFPVR
jgi:hypothetical protein